MWFGVLGPLQVHDDREAISIRPGHTQRVLCALISRANEYVSVTDLIDAQWAENPPASARQNTRRAIHWLRGTIGDPSRIHHSPAGYLLRLDSSELDVCEFTTLLERARQAGANADAAALYARALRLWRGRPCAGADDCAFLRPEIQRLVNLRTQAVEGNAAVNLALGNHADLIPELAGLVESDPTQERLAALYMRALAAAGRPADAQAVFWRVKDRLAEELGADPTPELRELYDAIVCGKLEVPPTFRAANAPAQLPADVHGFTGRNAELRHLDGLLTGTGKPPAVVISAVSGTAGVGKTALAVHWAHAAAHRFPDGQLYVNLRGFDPSGSVARPTDAVRGFLDALGVPPERIPPELDAQTALYRTQLAGKRVLVVLDNARDTEQVRPLLPGSPGCLALVTSRNDLAGLVVKEGAQPLFLDLLTDVDARKLLRERLGAQRVEAEPEAVDDIVAACAGLPLALAIVTARAAGRPQISLRTLADGIRGARRGLGAFAVADDPSADIRTVFSWSYDQLTAPAGRLFRLLGLHPGPDVSAPAAASLGGLPLARARSLLAELTSASLLTQQADGRYAFHDLLRAYASELAQTHEPQAERQQAMHRMLDHYLHTAFSAERLLFPARTPIKPAGPVAGCAPEQISSQEGAMRWFRAERIVLVALIDQAAAFGFDVHAWQLPWTLDTFLYRRGLWEERAAAWQQGFEATRRLGDPAVQARVLRISAYALTELDRIDEARDRLLQVLALDAELGDLAGQAHTQRALGRLASQQGGNREALEHSRRALELYQAAGERHGQANMLNAVGWLHSQLGEHEQARDYCEQALALQLALGNEAEAAATWDSLGYAHHHLGDHRKAVGCYEHALALYQKLGNQPREADSWVHLGDLNHLLGDLEATRLAWRRALTILEELDHPEAAGVRAKLAGLEPPPPDGGHA